MDIEVRFLPDSPEQIKKSLEGVRAQLDKAIKEAIDRVQKSKKEEKTQ
jgi:hypothetical protein